MENQKKTIFTYGFIVACVVLSKGLGLVREMCLAHFYGTSVMAAAFSTASKIPLVFFDITLGTAVSSAFIPVFNRALTQEGKEKAYAYANLFVTAAGGIAALFTALLLLFPKTSVKLMASGLTVEATDLAAALLRIMSPVVLIAVVCYSLVGILQSLGEFNRPAIMSTLSNVALVAYFFLLNDRFGIQGLAAALVVGWVLQVLILVRPLMRFGVKLRPRLDFHDPALKETALLALPVLISSWAQPINTVLSSNIASYLDGGNGSSIMVINYSYQLYFMLAGIFSYGLTNIFFPKLSRSFAAGDREGSVNLLHRMLTTVTLIVLPVLAFVAIAAPDLVRVAYESGEFTAQDSLRTGLALSIYIFGIIGFSWQEILNKFFYSAHDSRTPMVISFGAIGINVGLSFLLSRVIGVAGIALASTVSVTFQGGLLYLFSRKKMGEVKGERHTGDLVRGLIGAALAAGAIFLLQTLLPGTDGRAATLLREMAVFFGGMAVYGGALLIMKTKLVGELIYSLKRK